MTTSQLASNKSGIPHTYRLPMWRWILSYNIKDFYLFTIERIPTVYNNETIKT